MVGPVLDYVNTLAGIQRGRETPEGVYARVVDGQTLYVNTKTYEKRMSLHSEMRGMISDCIYSEVLAFGQQVAEVVL
jgi:beta-galactosidase